MYKTKFKVVRHKIKLCEYYLSLPWTQRELMMMMTLELLQSGENLPLTVKLLEFD
uniref:Uncharacterized protein n=1 Tax=Arion vulgaris TaxID=1028688 RepID=A0A0B7AV86_9EUPU